jgi:hypothetical protein
MNAMFVFVAALELRARKLRALIVSGLPRSWRSNRELVPL